MLVGAGDNMASANKAGRGLQRKQEDNQDQTKHCLGQMSRRRHQPARASAGAAGRGRGAPRAKTTAFDGPRRAAPGPAPGFVFVFSSVCATPRMIQVSLL
jgi:hypothetical protein